MNRKLTFTPKPVHDLYSIIKLFVIAKVCKQHTCALTGDWINNPWYFHILEHYSWIQRNEPSSNDKTYCCCSVTKSCGTLSDFMWSAESARRPCTFFQELLKLMSIGLVMPSNHLILCHFLLLLPSIFPSIRSFPMSWLFTSGGQNIGASASASVLLKNIQGWFLLGLTGLISLLSKELSRVFSSTAVWKHQCFGAQPSDLRES